MTDPEEYKATLRRFASGVTVVTVMAADGVPHGMTASSFASVSLEPPLILVCLAKSSRTRELVLAGGSFAVNILAAGQQEVARAFAERGTKPFATLSHRPGANGSPLLDGTIGWLECSIHEVLEAGDHDIVVGRVDACGALSGAPLIYHDRAYRSLNDS